jgi:hypothetical protein
MIELNFSHVSTSDFFRAVDSAGSLYYLLFYYSGSKKRVLGGAGKNKMQELLYEQQFPPYEILIYPNTRH